MTARDNWIDTLCAQVAFDLATAPRGRRDAYFDWQWFRDRKPRAADVPSPGEHFSAEWLRAHAEALWDVRCMLADGVSRLLFDAHLVLRAVGPYRCRIPRVDFEDWIVVHANEPFRRPGLPSDCTGRELRHVEASVDGSADRVQVVITEMQLNLCNAFRQYAPIREGVPLGPRRGDTVLDCGACIGDFAMLFAAMVGPTGAVHLFDPVPLHLRFCAVQAALNPTLGHVLHLVPAAVGATAGRALGTIVDLDHVSPGGLKVNAYETVTIDGYVRQAGLGRVDFIKMDIEGAELEAIAGGAGVIAGCRPRLAVSAYHRPSHLWEVPRAIRSLNPGYRLHFGHHMPIRWESVFYAVERR